jgi:thiol-disulfide isomerase/thioredoxin
VRIALRTVVTAVGAAGLLAVTAACSTGAQTADSSAGPVTSASPSAMATKAARSSTPSRSVPGSIVSLGDYQADPKKYADSDVVLFFNASWCPTCRDATENLTSESLPDGLTIVDVDYDSNTDLRQQYGVTTQHTFVHVDASGQELVTFTGSTTADQILGQLA